MKTLVAVVGGGVCSDAEAALAREVGARLAEAGIGVVCGGGGFASRLPGARSSLVWARLQPASPVSFSAPTHPSTGRAAMKPRRAGYVRRYASRHASAN